jgi:hypothetical protein
MNEEQPNDQKEAPKEQEAPDAREWDHDRRIRRQFE